MQEKVKKKRNRLTERLEKRDAKRSLAYLERVFEESAYFGVAYVLGNAEMAFGTSPLGLALLCAGRGHVLAILAGLLLSAVMHPSRSAVYAVMYGVAAIVRIVSRMLLEGDDRTELRKRAKEKLDAARGEASPLFGEVGIAQRIRAELSLLFSERVRLRMATAAVCSMVVSLYRVFVGGFTYYDWFAAVFCVLVTPAAVMIYAIYLDGHSTHRWLYVISASFLLYSLVWSASGLWIAYYPLPLILAIFFTLYATLTMGTAFGCFAGVLCGVAIHFLTAPAFLLAALVFSAFRSKRKGAAGILPAVSVALIWLLYVGGVAQLQRLVPALLIGGAAFTPVCVYLRGKEERKAREEMDAAESDSVRRRLAGQHRESANEHLRGISEAYATLSEMFYNLSDRFRRPGTLDLRCICDRVFDSHCDACPSKTVCWGLEYAQTLQTVNQLISRLHTHGCVTKEQIPSHLSGRCASVDAIVEDINRDCARLTGELLRNNRTEILAMDYEAAASIISDALEEDAGEYCFDDALEARVSEYLRDAGVSLSSVTVYGQRRRQILVRGADVEHATVTADILRSDLGEMCGMRLGLPTFEVEGGVSTMLLQSQKKIAVLGAQNNVAANGDVSGDSVNLFSNKKDYFYALINDGMGAGKSAAFTSGLCSVFLEKMLRAGNRAGTSLRMLNNMIRSRGADSTNECSSTVDLLELDLMTAEATFIKSGAAPSLVVRGGTVHRLQSGTAPIGILGNLDAQVRKYQVRAGDTLVLISDGIEQNDPDLRWLTSYLATSGDCSPEEIVYCICRHAASAERHDDCSAIAIRILDAEE